MQQLKSVEPAGLYIHIPFCKKKCPYCDFYSVTDLSLQPAYVEALLAEIRLRASSIPAADTVYVGGGTPSTLPAESLRRILTAVRKEVNLAPEPEVTLEVNPGSVSPGQLTAYRDMGVNRLHIGAQSFQAQNLAFLGRMHDAGQIADTIGWARRAGFDNLGLDLIYALPGQRPRLWEKDLRQAAGHGVEHLSCYTLTYEEGTRMGSDLQQGRVRPLSQEAAAELMVLTVERLREYGYHRYEVSNFARSAKWRSRHNQKYWSQAPYVGLGPSAHSWIAPQRCWNRRNVAAYIADLAGGRLPTEGRERLDRRQMITEAVYLGLRTADGIDTARFKRQFGVKFENLFAGVLGRLEFEGLLSSAGGRVAVTEPGMLLLDSVAAEFVDLID